MTVADVCDWRPGPLVAAGDQLAADRRRVGSAREQLDPSHWPARWSGAAAESAGAAGRACLRELEERAAELTAVMRALDAAAPAVARARDVLEEALHAARGEGFGVSPIGHVDDRYPPLLVGHAAADRERRRIELAERIDEALRAARATDAELAGWLRRVAAGITAGPPADGSRPRTTPPPAASPAVASAWFATLTREEQQRATAEHAARLGNLDGIPAWARHTANASRLADLRRDHGPHEALDVLHRVLRDDRDHRLLLLDLAGDEPRAVIAVGDLDTADHVVVHVPGMGAAVDDRLAGRLTELEQLVTRAGSSGTGSAAGVLWLGYAAPQRDLSVLDPERSVLTPGAAADGAEDLAGFLVGVDHARAADPRLTLVGHSYGSVVAGLAAHASTGLDALVVAGSPGLGTDDVGDLDVADVYVLEADLDPVADLGWFGTDPSRLGGVTRLPTDAEGDLAGVRGHSAYLADGSTSQQHLAEVVAGAQPAGRTSPDS